MKKSLLLLVLPLLAIPSVTLSRTPSAEDSTVYIVSPADGATVSNPVTVVFGLRGMGVAPAGVNKENTGHHHLIVDAQLPDLNQPIPSSDNYRHFGKGQTETTLALPPGQHTLQLLLGDFSHIPHDAVVASDMVTITVQ